MRIDHFTDLIVYQKAGSLSHDLFVLSRTWLKEETYSLTDQIRRASRSVGANLSEAWGKRRYEAHFVSKLTDADGENHEVEHWLITARDDGYIAEAQFVAFRERKREVGRLLGSMIQHPEPFIIKSEPGTGRGAA